MYRDYTLTSPSLEGVLSHVAIEYGGVIRPPIITRIFDRPRSLRRLSEAHEERALVERYFHDLYGVLVKKLSEFTIATTLNEENALKIQAMLQELIKVKKLLVSDS